MNALALSFFVVALLLPGVATAQVSLVGTLSGTATDAENGEPLVGAHAFIGSTMIGTATDRQGFFKLRRIPTGQHTLWISMIGYEPVSKDFLVGDSTVFEFDLSLEPAIIEIGELTVTAKRDRRWKKRLNRFRKLFLGETPFAESAHILNPEVLDFEANWLGRFSAHASEPITIDNLALGYRVQYVLKEFTQEGSTIRYDGDPLFEELEPASPEQAAAWKLNRENAFKGSFRHFLLALLDGKTEDEGFRILRVPSIEDIPNQSRRFRISPNQLLEAGKKRGDTLLSFSGVIEITYLYEREGEDYLKWNGSSSYRPKNNQRSWIRLTSGATLIDPNGEIVDPYGVTVYGYYAYERIANDLPKEFRLDDDSN